MGVGPGRSEVLALDAGDIESVVCPLIFTFCYCNWVVYRYLKLKGITHNKFKYCTLRDRHHTLQHVNAISQSHT